MSRDNAFMGAFAARKVTDDTPRFANIRDGISKPVSDRVWFVFAGVAVASAAFIIGSIVLAYALYPVEVAL